MRLVAPRSVTPPASDSACSTVVSASLERVGAGVLHLAEHVDRLGARHEDRVAVAQRDVLREHAALQVLEVHALRLVASAFCAGQRRAVGLLAGRRADDDGLEAGGGRGRAGPRDRLDQRHVAGERVGARLPHLADDEDALAAVGLDRDADLRVLEVAVGQLLLELAPRTGAASGRRPSRGRSAER